MEAHCLGEITLKCKLLLFIVWHVARCLAGTDPRSGSGMAYVYDFSHAISRVGNP